MRVNLHNQESIAAKALPHVNWHSEEIFPAFKQETSMDKKVEVKPSTVQKADAKVFVSATTGKFYNKL